MKGMNIMNKLLKALVPAVILTTTLCFTGCGSNSGTGNTEIKIGEFGPLTGDSATDGTQAKDGAVLAVEQINKSGGVLGKKIKLITMDDEAKAPESMSVVQKLLQSEKVTALISGSYSTPTKTVSSVVQQAKTPMVVAYATNPDITKNGNYVFRTIYSGDTQGKAVADYAVQDKSLKNFAVLYVNNDYGNGNGEAFISEAKKLGANVCVSRKFDDGTKDFRSMLTLVKDKNPDAIYIGSYYNEASQICLQAKELGMNVQILGDDGFDSPDFLSLAGKSAEGAIFSTPFFRDDPSKNVQDFVKAYKAKFNKDPDMLSAQAYDSAMLLADAIKRANSTDKDAIRKALSETNDFNGITGKIKFDKNNEVIKPVILDIVKDGKFTLLKNQAITK